MQSFGIGIAQFELDMLAVALDCFSADAELARDLTGAVPKPRSKKERLQARVDRRFKFDTRNQLP